MSTRDDILAEIEKFLKETGMSATKFGEDAIKDRALMLRLRTRGRDLKLATVDKIRAFMANERKKRARPPPKKARDQRAEAA